MRPSTLANVLLAVCAAACTSSLVAQEPAAPPQAGERLRVEARRMYVALVARARDRVNTLGGGAEDGERLLDDDFRAAFAAAAAPAADGGGGPGKVPDADALLAARAALVALAVFTDPESTLLRNPFASGLLGGLEDAAERAAKAKFAGTPTLRGRNDWVRHFLVSAALVALVGEEAARLAGVQKELADARGMSAGKGTGFSFGDLCADEAGVRFAVWLGREPAQAPARLASWARSFTATDFFPVAKDLPECLPEEEFRARYGGVGGGAYREMVAEIVRRIRECPGYR
ncbi:MAG: hypothetical protein HYZ53_19950 [Planctomycetes bacterium]|nr:hypothetical protein [Planctomycetota bacterium]